ncbi:T6SS immunity protein Tdi1 domain-containing protein [Catellatospora sp. NPDC049609]|uniref:T6SS immunity protein Tdi1 domain-containing protein n=1 Tax=Catellatospora sp. NPDC049609 TaxID=3155505 RepID=UPI00343307B2
MFSEFHPVAPIADETISRYAAQVPADAVQLWRSHGAGFVGDGYFRFVDPARAATMLAGVFGLPDSATVLFTTGLGDVICHVNGLYLMVKSRFGSIDVVQGQSFASLVALLQDTAQREAAWEWQPYPAARDRDGVPGFEQCFGYAPLLALGGSPDASHLQLGGLYEHLAVIAQLAGQPQVRRPLQFATAQVPPAAGLNERLAQIGRELMAQLTENAALNVMPLPDGLGVRVVHAVRGGATIYVAPDESVLFAASAVSPDVALEAFRAGNRTPKEKFRRGPAAG